jgi:hypothetical protein
MAHWVAWLDAQQGIQQMWIGRLESLLARHWPEATRLMELSSVTLLETLAHYGGPAPLVADANAASRLVRWGGPFLTTAKIERLLASAAQTVGVLQDAYALERMRQYAAMALAAYRQVQRAQKQLERLAKDNATIQRQAKAIGVVTACVLWVALGDPAAYPCGEAYRKAMGLNLKERSSGKHQGQLKITRRGPALVRRWMYFAAMRQVRSVFVKPWFEAKKARDQGRGKGALIAVARKLALALHAVGAHGQPFEPWRLFPSSQELLKEDQQRERKERRSSQRDADGSEKSDWGPAPKPPGFIASGPRIKRKGGGELRP